MARGAGARPGMTGIVIEVHAIAPGPLPHLVDWPGRFSTETAKTTHLTAACTDGDRRVWTLDARWMPATATKESRLGCGCPPQPQVFCFVMGSGWCRTRISEHALMGVSSTWKRSFTDVPRRRRKTASEHKLAFDQWRLLFGASSFQLLGILGRAFKLAAFRWLAIKETNSHNFPQQSGLLK